MAGSLIADNIKSIQKQISEAAKSANRNPSEIQLMAVSKFRTHEEVAEATNAGLNIFGENYAQELLQKKSELQNPKIEWQFIGALQRNKVKLVVGEVDLIQSVDRIELAETISKVASEKNLVQKILIQLNPANEESKSGISPDEFKLLAEKILALPNIEIAGLMAMPPLTDDIDEQKKNFDLCKNAFDQLQELAGDSVTVLSMGTTNDFPAAIAAGSTMIRVGTALFGPRPSM